MVFETNLDQGEPTHPRSLGLHISPTDCIMSTSHCLIEPLPLSGLTQQTTNSCLFFLIFSHKRGFDISRKLSPLKTICMESQILWRLIVLGFNDTSTLVGHFVSSPREREKRDRRDSRRDEREEQGRKRNRNDREETEEIKTFPLYPYLLQG